MYQLTDEYHMNYLGGGLLAGLELPLAKRWTILTNGTITVDYPNLGTNRLVQPFDLVRQYNVSVGVQYSKRGKNKYSYLRKIRFKKPKAKGTQKETAEILQAEKPENEAETDGKNEADGKASFENGDEVHHAENR